MSSPMSPRALLELILRSGVYPASILSQEEIEAFKYQYGILPVNVWEKFRTGDTPYTVEVRSGEISFDRDNLVAYQLTNAGETIMQISVSNSDVYTDDGCRRPLVRTEASNSTHTHLTAMNAAGVSYTTPEVWFDVGPKGCGAQIASYSKMNGDWNVVLNVVMLVVVPKAKPTNPGKTTKEYTAMKPEFMKKPSVTRHAEHMTSSTPNAWCTTPPALIIGDGLVEVDVSERTDEEVGELRREWFWSERAHPGTFKRTTISFEMALDRQDDLIDTAKAFIGIQVFTGYWDGVQHYLPIKRKDDMSLLCLLDRSVWTQYDSVYPSCLDDWINESADQAQVLAGGVTEALLMQADVLRARAIKPVSETKATTSKKRKPSSKGPEGGSGKVTSE